MSPYFSEGGGARLVWAETRLLSGDMHGSFKKRQDSCPKAELFPADYYHVFTHSHIRRQKLVTFTASLISLIMTSRSNSN